MESPVLRRELEIDSKDLVKILEENDLEEFTDFVKEQNLNGKTILNVTEADVKLWKGNTNAEKFVIFINELKHNPHKYTVTETVTKRVKVTIEHQYQTVNVNRKVKERSKTIDEIMKNIVPAKSFLYRYQKPIKLSTPYVPMDASPKKPRKFFRLSSYDYPFFDLKSRFSRSESDRGYYSIKTNIQKSNRTPEGKRKCKSIATTQELEKDEISEDHFYEDLCYNDLEKGNDKISTATRHTTHMNVKPCVVKIQELFNSFKLPFFKRDGTKETETKEEEKDVKVVQEIETKQDDASGHLYENNDNSTDVMYDYPIKRHEDAVVAAKQSDIIVEDYLEPIPVEREYCDIGLQKEDSLLTYIMNIFDNFSIRKDTTDITNSEGSDMESRPDTKTGAEKPKKVERKLRGTSMADRPLPVPVENEPYYMNISRVEAENLLMGHPDGTFILRPTTQPNHAYTISVACCNSVHNVGVRRRTDGRLALGYARKGERSFTSISSLLRHHRKRRLVLVASGGVLGATTLNESPMYYQIPKNLPVCQTIEK